MSLFTAIDVPTHAAGVLESNLKPFASIIVRRIPLKKWHITLHFLGDVDIADIAIEPLTAELPIEFLPTTTITHIGLSPDKRQLWAYCRPTPAFLQLRATLTDRLRAEHIAIKNEARDFIPHITLAHVDTTDQTTLPAPDLPIQITLPVHDVTLFESRSTADGTRYTPVATIKAEA